MKQHHGYELDFSNKRIVVTKSFLKEAGIIGSVAYAELAKVRKDYPDFKIMQRVIKQKQGKKTYGNLTYKAMKEFIEAQESEEVAPFVLTEFQRIQDLSKAYSAQYVFVKNWFLNRYREVFTQEDAAEEKT